ncbi:MAG: hypothetical protein R3D02_14695 [Hyphomicrobiales bacterium]
MRRSSLALALVAGLTVALLGAFLHAASSVGETAARLEETRHLVARLGLSDLTLFTEARYTRHPAMADLHTPFQDHPMAFEHFPSGTLVPPPAHLPGGELRIVPAEDAR